MNSKLVVVQSSGELIAEYQRIVALGVPLMIQELIPGEESALVGYLAFWDGEGNERAWLTKVKLRQYPPQFGDGALQKIVEAPKVAELSRRLLRAYGYRGFVGVEFKFDARDNSYRLMEINARTVSGNQLAISAGVDFPWIGYQYLTGANIGPDSITPIYPQTVWVHEGLDIQAYQALRKSGTFKFWDWLGSLYSSPSRAIGAWDDPLPLLMGLGRLPGRVVSKFITRK